MLTEDKPPFLLLHGVYLKNKTSVAVTKFFAQNIKYFNRFLRTVFNVNIEQINILFCQFN